MATKSEMVEELAGFGIEASEDQSWSELDERLRAVRAEREEAVAEAEDEWLEETPAEVVEEVRSDEETFTVDQLKPHARRLFGVPPQVLVGAQSAGLLTEPTTKAAAAEAVRRFQEGS